MGIAQIIPHWHPGVNPMDPNASLKYAAHWMSQLYQKYGNYKQALSVYNSGNPNAYQTPGQTSNYVNKILGESKTYQVPGAPAAPPPGKPGRPGRPGIPGVSAIPGKVTNLMPLLKILGLGGLPGIQQLAITRGPGTPGIPGIPGIPGMAPVSPPQPVPAKTATVIPGGMGILPGRAKIGRVDQGVDVSSPGGAVTALGPGHVYAVTPWAVYYTLDKPVTIGGRTYSNVYVAETQHPLVKVGQRLAAGSPVAAYTPQTPWSEIGFAAGTSQAPVASPFSPPIGGLGAGTRPSQAGKDFLKLITHLNRR